MSEDHPNIEHLWRWRRRFAIAAFLCGFLETLALLTVVPAVKLEALGAVVAWSYGFWTVVILAYVLNAAAETFIEKWAERGGP